MFIERWQILMAGALFGLAAFTCLGHVAFQTLWAVGIGGKPFTPTGTALDILSLFGFQRLASQSSSPYHVECKVATIGTFCLTFSFSFFPLFFWQLQGRGRHSGSYKTVLMGKLVFFVILTRGIGVFLSAHHQHLPYAACNFYSFNIFSLCL